MYESDEEVEARRLNDEWDQREQLAVLQAAATIYPHMNDWERSWANAVTIAVELRREVRRKFGEEA